MSKLKAIINFLDTFFLSVWGITLMDLLPLIDLDLFSSLDNTIKTLMALAGFVYFVITIPHKLKMNKINRKIKQEELEKITKENDKKE